MSVAINGTNGITFNDGSLQPSAPEGQNLIINGDMRIDQRGGTVTINTASRTYGVDRWLGYGQSSDGVFTIVQDTEAPTGFSNSTKITTTTADASVGASQFYIFGQSIEGTNFSHLAWGSASAKTVTLSFWVRSSLTGTFGGAINNNTANRSYPFTYTIDSANTWEQKSVTITGDTSGTWITTAGIGANVWFDLGCGSSNVGTAGTWAAAGYYGATGTTSLIGTSGATFYITGVQLEANTTATPFEHLQYGQQLALCQRYFFRWTDLHVVCPMAAYSTTAIYGPFVYPTTMRATPTWSVSSASNLVLYMSGTTVPTAFSAATITKNSARLSVTVSSARTQGHAGWLRVNTGSGKYIQADAEL